MRGWAALVLAVAVAGCGGGGGGGGGGHSNSGSSGTGTGTGTLPPATGLVVGTGVRVLSPGRFETWTDSNGNGIYDAGEPFADAGVDRLFDWQEPGALGPDGAAGRAGVDDNQNGVLDDAGEYLAAGSDDVRDPAGDDASPSNPTGTEGDRRFQIVPLAGFGGFYSIIGGQTEYRACQGILDDIESRSIALSDGATDMILQSNDLVGMLHIDINPVKRRIERELGVPFRNVIISSTHVHSSPDTIGIWAGPEFDDLWLAEVREQMFQSAREAFLARRPAIVKSATVEPETAIERGTLVMKRAPAVRIADQYDVQMDPAQGYDEFVLQTDLRDPVVRNTKIVAQRFDDPQTGAPIATLVNWHDHPETMGSKNDWISADFPGWVRKAVERRFGGTCIYFSGTVGGQIGALRSTLVPLVDASGVMQVQPGVFDANFRPVPQFVTDDGADKARSIGLVVADEAIRALEAQAYTYAPALSVRSEDLDIDLENLVFQALTFTLTTLGRGEPQDQPITGSPYTSAVGAIRAQISMATIGDVEIVTFPGECPPEYAVGRRASTSKWPGWPDYYFPPMPAVEDWMPRRDRMAFSLANNYLGYLIAERDTLDIWDMSHPNFYEELVSAGRNFGDNCGNKLMQMLGSPARFSNYPIRP